MKCPKCQTELPDGANFCFECGVNLQVSVADSNRPPKRAKARLVPERERKHVMALFSDFTGYKAITRKIGSKRIHQDEATCLRLVKDEMRFQWVAH
jgi:hypothetical protein